MKHSMSCRATFIALLGAALASIGASAQASLFVVDRTDDALVSTCTPAPNDCSLRGAIGVAVPGDTIEFDASVLAPAVISITSPLPPLNVGAVTIQGPLSDPPQVILDGSGAPPGTDGLRLESDNNVLLGLWIRNFPGDGVVIDEAANNRLGPLECTYAGLLHQTGNGGWGIRITGEAADFNRIGSQRIGTDGSIALGNGSGGVLIEAGADDNQIGAGCTMTMLMQANAGPGIALLDAGTDGNKIQVANIGSLALPNSGDGILIDGASNSSIGNVVRIVGNSGDGLRIESGSGNRFFGGASYGRIHDNGGIGINLVAPGDPPSGVTLNDPGDIDSGPNGLLNYPEIVSVVGAGGGNVTVSGSACANCQVELYQSDGDPSGHGEGAQQLGQTSADPAGLWSATIPLALGASVTALTTDLSQNVSEFSPAVLNPVDVYVVDRTDDALIIACTPAPNDCSLRGAISISGTGDFIEFDASVLAPAVISITSPLPPLNVGAVTIQGPLSDPPQVILDGSGAPPGTDGLRLESDNNVLLGLWIRNFPGDGVVIDEAANNRLGPLECTYAGLLHQTGNGGWGIRITGEAADFNRIGSQRIGTDGSIALGNGSGGVLIEAGADDNQIGAGCTMTMLMQANAGPGIALLDAGTDGNKIQVANIGSLAFPNGGDGILIDGASNSSIGNVVRIVGNSGDGLRIESGSGNRFFGTGSYGRIHDNGGIGINLVAPGDPASGVTLNDPGDVDSGPNGLLNYPEIVSVVGAGGGNVTVSGSACANCQVELYQSDGDPSGYGEGAQQLGQTSADPTGLWSATIPLMLGASVTALTTDLLQNVSEFSPAVLSPVDVYVVDRTDDALIIACTPAPNDCSLRGAISIAGTGDFIEFDAAVLAPAFISITSPLPPLNVGAVTIQGPLTDPPQVILDGSGAPPGTDGLRLESDNNVLLGLWIRNFPGDGVVIDEAANNRLGPLPCTSAGLLHQTGNGGWGLRIRGEAADFNRVSSYRIGTDGSSALGNAAGGVLIEAGADNNEMGAGCAITTLIQANGGPGIALLDAGTDGNSIGVANIGSLAFPNGGDGILIDGASNSSIGNVVRIVGNAGDGLRIESGSGNVYQGLGGNYSRISDNGGIGINLVAPGDPATGVTVNDFGDADTGPNQLLNFPVLRQIAPLGGGSYRLLGTACANCAVDVAKSDNDPSGYGESLSGLGQATADAFGVWTRDVLLGIPVASLNLTAAATRSGVGTSELALGFNVVNAMTTGATCGNLVQEPGEECEDSNATSNDGCSAACTIELCGDALLQWGIGEQCDDGNLINGDGCTNGCLAVSPAIIVTPTSGLITAETGTSDTFTVSLATPPQSPVTLQFFSSDPSEGTVAPAQVVFDANTWNVPATITVTGVDDGIGDGDQPYQVNTTVSTTDPYYAALSAADVNVLNLDDDADLSIAMSSSPSAVLSGQTITWTIVVSNLGPSMATAATVQDTFPAGVGSLTWTCVVSGGASCTAAGSGNLLDLVSLPPGSTATYTATGTATAPAPAQLTNVASITIQGPATDPVASNNIAQSSVEVVTVALFSDGFEVP